MAWLKEEGFGGIMIWSVDMDDFRGSCGSGKYPLINAMRQELEGYKVKLEFEGPYETIIGSGQYTTKDRKQTFLYFKELWFHEQYFYKNSTPKAPLLH